MFSATVLVLACESSALACDYKPPPPRETVPYPPNYQFGFVTYAPNGSSPVHLPANALGVVYNAAPSGNIAMSGVVVTEEDTGQRLTLRTTRLSALPGQSMLYRLGPADGFQIGKRYKFTSKAAEQSATHVVIDPVSINLQALVVRMAPGGSLYRSWYDPDNCVLTHDIKAELKQPIAYDMPAALRPYRQLLFAFHGTGWSGDVEANYSPWHRGLRDGVLTVDAADLTTRKLQASTQFAFMEIEDRRRATASVSLSPDAAEMAFAESASLLELAVDSGDTGKLAEELRAVPRVDAEGIRSAAKRGFWSDKHHRSLRDKIAVWWDRRRFQTRRLSLINQVGAQLAHSQPGIRRLVPPAVLNVSRYDGLNLTGAERVIDILLKGLRDPDEQVRHLSLDSLIVLKARATRLQLALDMTRFGQAIPALAELMRSGSVDHRLNAAEVLSSLPASAYGNNSALRQTAQLVLLAAEREVAAPPPVHAPAQESIFTMCQHAGPCIAAD